MPRSLEAILVRKLTDAFSNGKLYAPKTDSERRGLKRRVRKGTVTSPYKGLYALKDQWAEAEKPQQYKMIIATLAELYPSWVFCSFSAASMQGLEVPFTEMNRIHIATTCSRRTHGLVCHHMKINEHVTVNGVKCASVESSVFECIRNSDFKYALAVADSALRLLKLNANEMIDRLATKCKGKHGMAYVKDVFSHANSKAENGGESYARAVMIENGVMLPKLQVEHYDQVTKTKYRDDFEWELKTGNVAGELDGNKKYTLIAKERGLTIEQVLLEERQRESRLRNQGLKFARFSFDQLRNVAPFLDILDACGIPRIGTNPRAPKPPTKRRTITQRTYRRKRREPVKDGG